MGTKRPFAFALICACIAACTPSETPPPEAPAQDEAVVEPEVTALPEPTAPEPAPQPESTKDSFLPPPDFLVGWTRDGEVKRYDSDTLFDHINGEADVYYPYGFVGVETTRYVHGTAENTAVTADVYEMGSLLEAFGIYSNYRPADAETIALGVEGIRGDYQLLFYKDMHFVRINASGEPGDTREAMTACGEAIAGALPGTNDPPTELDFIAIDGIVPDSVKYIAESLLGYRCFPHGLVANTHADRDTDRVFVVFPPAGTAEADTVHAGEAAVEGYIAYLEENSARFDWVATDTSRRLIARDPLYGMVTIEPRDAYAVGVADIADSKAAPDLMRQLLDRLTPSPEQTPMFD